MGEKRLGLGRLLLVSFDTVEYRVGIPSLFQFKDLREALLFGLPPFEQIAQPVMEIASALSDRLFVPSQRSARGYENAVLPAVEVPTGDAMRCPSKFRRLVL